MLIKVRIDSKALVGGYPALTILKLVRRLNNLTCWDVETVRFILRTERDTAEAIIRALVEAGLAVSQPTQGTDSFTTTPLAPAFGTATAAKPITRRTADQALFPDLRAVRYSHMTSRKGEPDEDSAKAGKQQPVSSGQHGRM
jgi:hypothetical protein